MKVWVTAVGLMAGVLALSGCASWPRPDMDAWKAASAEQSACARWMGELDQAVNAAGVGDAQDARIRGFPHLRASRLSDALRTKASRGTAAMADWIALLQRQGRAGQAVELANLPGPVLTDWMVETDVARAREQALDRLNACSDRLAAAVLASPDLQEQLLATDPVPDAYSTAARWAGIYPLSRVPFSWGVQRWQAGTLEMFARESVRAQTGEPFKRYTPSAAAQADDRRVAQALQRTPADALGMPRLDRELTQVLLDHHAPVFEVRHRADHDRPGRIVWGGDGLPSVQPDQPVVYRRIAFTRLGGETLVQLVYLVWFSERPRSGPLDLLGGRLDGVIWRVTLDAQGQPLLYDSIHACGCYHLFFPDVRLREKPSPEPGIEWVFSPSPLVRPGPGERVMLRLDAATHYLMAVGVTSDMGGIPYTVEDEDTLRSLPWPPGGPQARRSLYGPDGIVAGTQRRERWLFWPMGVRDPGAQRQWGHHATAFVGRRHYDDPDLIERRFERIDDPR